MMKSFWTGRVVILFKKSFEHGFVSDLRDGLKGEMLYSVWEGG